MAFSTYAQYTVPPIAADDTLDWATQPQQGASAPGTVNGYIRTSATPPSTLTTVLGHTAAVDTGVETGHDAGAYGPILVGKAGSVPSQSPFAVGDSLIETLTTTGFYGTGCPIRVTFTTPVQGVYALVQTDWIMGGVYHSFRCFGRFYDASNTLLGSCEYPASYTDTLNNPNGDPFEDAGCNDIPMPVEINAPIYIGAQSDTPNIKYAVFDTSVVFPPEAIDPACEPYDPALATSPAVIINQISIYTGRSPQTFTDGATLVATAALSTAGSGTILNETLVLAAAAAMRGVDGTGLPIVVPGQGPGGPLSPDPWWGLHRFDIKIRREERA